MKDYLPASLPIAGIILLSLPLLTLANNNTTIADFNTTTADYNVTAAAASSTVITDNQTEVQLTAVYGTTFSPASSVVPDVVITIAVIAGCGLLGLGVAKLGDYLYDRRMATRDDISNASEYTKNILRTRLAVMKMKSDPSNEEAKTAKKAASAWIENTVKKVNSARGSMLSLSPEQIDQTSTDVEKADAMTIEKGGDDKVFTADVRPPPTITVIPTTTLNTPTASPLPHNKVSPGDPPKPLPTMPTSSEEIQGLPASTRGNALPPISPRPEAPPKSINQPIRSTR